MTEIQRLALDLARKCGCSKVCQPTILRLEVLKTDQHPRNDPYWMRSGRHG